MRPNEQSPSTLYREIRSAVAEKKDWRDISRRCFPGKLAAPNNEAASRRDAFTARARNVGEELARIR